MRLNNKILTCVIVLSLLLASVPSIYNMEVLAAASEKSIDLYLNEYTVLPYDLEITDVKVSNSKIVRFWKEGAELAFQGIGVGNADISVYFQGSKQPSSIIHVKVVDNSKVLSLKYVGSPSIYVKKTYVYLLNNNSGFGFTDVYLTLYQGSKKVSSYKVNALPAKGNSIVYFTKNKGVSNPKKIKMKIVALHCSNPVTGGKSSYKFLSMGKTFSKTKKVNKKRGISCWKYNLKVTYDEKDGNKPGYYDCCGIIYDNRGIIEDFFVLPEKNNNQITPGNKVSRKGKLWLSSKILKLNKKNSYFWFNCVYD